MALLSLSRRLGVFNPMESNTMTRTIMSPLALASTAALTAAVEEARDEVGASFERLCLIAGLASLTQMLEEDAVALAGVFLQVILFLVAALYIRFRGREIRSQQQSKVMEKQ